MKLHEALRKTIRHYGISVIEDKRLLSFLAGYRAFDDFPAMKEVMRFIAAGDYGKRLCLAADGSDEDFLRFASELKEALMREKGFKEEFADYAIDSISFALGIPCAATVTEPCDHGYDAVQKNTGSLGSTAAHESRPQASPAVTQASSPRQSTRTAFVISGDTWQTASDGAESHRRFCRGHDLTAAFESGEFSRNVEDGSFMDIFPGDCIRKHVTVPEIKAPDGSVYIPRKSYTVKFIIADLDIALNRGHTLVTAHHAVIVPENPPFKSYMNPTNTNLGGYVLSFMHGVVLPAFAQGLRDAFGAQHLLNCNYVGSPARPSSFCMCRLMTLSMVFGQTPPWWGYYTWSDFDRDLCLGGTQLAAFRLNKDLQGGNMSCWLSDVPSSARPWSPKYFAAVSGGHNSIAARVTGASRERGIRPFALQTIPWPGRAELPLSCRSPVLPERAARCRRIKGKPSDDESTKGPHHVSIGDCAPFPGPSAQHHAVSLPSPAAEVPRKCSPRNPQEALPLRSPEPANAAETHK